MCDPASAMLAISVVSAGAGYVGSQRQAKDQINASNRAALTQQEQIDAKANLEATERSRQGARERATMRVASGESGVAGASPMAMLMDSLFQEGYDNSITEYNRSNSIDASRAENSARNVDASGKATTLFETGLQIGSATMDYAGTSAGKKLTSNYVTNPWANASIGGPRKLK